MPSRQTTWPADRPLGADRRAAFEEILAAQIADIEAAVAGAGRRIPRSADTH
ncbi:hypothetical protein [Streptomyces sp. NPDC015130]|uniref:hypothetical protein n=1 Tax=Streptomyces sp. NPDC015130 TaxID=3364940 RepID=UPI0036F53E47